MFKAFLIAAALAATTLAQAQTPTPPAAPAAPPSAAKKELVARILKLQQPGFEATARRIVEQPAAQMLQQAGQAIQQRVPADKRKSRRSRNCRRMPASMSMRPTRRCATRSPRLASTTIGPLLEQRLSEDELRQVLAVFESAAFRKYQGLTGEMEKALMEKLAPQARPIVETNARALQQTMARRLDAATGAASAPAPAAAAGPKK